MPLDTPRRRSIAGGRAPRPAYDAVNDTSNRSDSLYDDYADMYADYAAEDDHDEPLPKSHSSSRNGGGGGPRYQQSTDSHDFAARSQRRMSLAGSRSNGNSSDTGSGAPVWNQRGKTGFYGDGGRGAESRETGWATEYIMDSTDQESDGGTNDRSFDDRFSGDRYDDRRDRDRSDRSAERYAAEPPRSSSRSRHHSQPSRSSSERERGARRNSTYGRRVVDDSDTDSLGPQTPVNATFNHSANGYGKGSREQHTPTPSSGAASGLRRSSSKSRSATSSRRQSQSHELPSSGRNQRRRESDEHSLPAPPRPSSRAESTRRSESRQERERDRDRSDRERSGKSSSSKASGMSRSQSRGDMPTPQLQNTPTQSLNNRPGMRRFDSAPAVPQSPRPLEGEPARLKKKTTSAPAGSSLQGTGAIVEGHPAPEMQRRKSLSTGFKWGGKKGKPITISTPILPEGFVESLGMPTFALVPGQMAVAPMPIATKAPGTKLTRPPKEEKRGHTKSQSAGGGIRKSRIGEPIQLSSTTSQHHLQPLPPLNVQLDDDVESSLYHSEAADYEELLNDDRGKYLKPKQGQTAEVRRSSEDSDISRYTVDVASPNLPEKGSDNFGYSQYAPSPASFNTYGTGRGEGGASKKKGGSSGRSLGPTPSIEQAMAFVPEPSPAPTRDGFRDPWGMNGTPNPHALARGGPTRVSVGSNTTVSDPTKFNRKQSARSEMSPSQVEEVARFAAQLTNGQKDRGLTMFSPWSDNSESFNGSKHSSPYPSRSPSPLPPTHGNQLAPPSKSPRPSHHKKAGSMHARLHEGRKPDDGLRPPPQLLGRRPSHDYRRGSIDHRWPGGDAANGPPVPSSMSNDASTQIDARRGTLAGDVVWGGFGDDDELPPLPSAGGGVFRNPFGGGGGSTPSTSTGWR